MCRFLAVKASNNTKVLELLSNFSIVCKKSKEYQGDGWGISWLDGSQHWRTYHSLSPIWEDNFDELHQVMTTNFMVHARSATLENQKGMIECNQPITSGALSFAANISIQGMQTKLPISGITGAHKIFNITKDFYKVRSDTALHDTSEFLQKHARYIRGANMVLNDTRLLAGVCLYGEDPDYFSLRTVDTTDVKMICSEEFGGYSWRRMVPGEEIVYE